MKIEKGYTLSQFVDYLTLILDKLETCDSDSHYLDMVIKYNDFLKQPLTKDMFINKIELPNRSLLISGFSDRMLYENKLKLWQESENKVIFKGWKPDNTNQPYLVKRLSMTYSVEFSQDGIIFYIAEPFGSIKSYKIKTIADLFRIANVDLELQNVEI